MENAKDTFYAVMRERLAAVNAARTAVVRSAVRPGLVVAENELPNAAAPADLFTMVWTGLSVDVQGALPLVAMECEFRYATAGGSDAAGMDRGRALSAMDAELVAMAGAEPRTALKMNYQVAVPERMGTRVFWSEPVFGVLEVTGERLARVATVTVLSYQEAGER